ncbi:hypothetical protein [Rhizobium sp. YTU87027]|uniref:hypothetical protein n=1 Tax=Rhizobium sp. YTU87027 TaxID=3417741 RepID=UPI003D6878DB
MLIFAASEGCATPISAAATATAVKRNFISSSQKNQTSEKLKTVWLEKTVRRSILSQAGTRVKVVQPRSHIDNKAKS